MIDIVSTFFLIFVHMIFFFLQMIDIVCDVNFVKMKNNVTKCSYLLKINNIKTENNKKKNEVKIYHN